MRSAVLVIDMIRGMERWIPKARMKAVVARLGPVLERARRRGVPVIYVVHRPLGKAGTAVYDAIRPRRGDRKILKDHYSGFYGTPLDRLLKRLQVKGIVLTGVSTHWCVLTTAVDASYRNYKIALLEDCAAAPARRKHKLAIAWLKETIPITVKRSKGWRP